MLSNIGDTFRKSFLATSKNRRERERQEMGSQDLLITAHAMFTGKWIHLHFPSLKDVYNTPTHSKSNEVETKQDF